MKETDPIDEVMLNAVAETWGPAVKAVYAGDPSPETLARIRTLAAQGLGTRRRRVFFARIRPFLVSAAAASIVGVATLPVGGPLPLICTPGVPVLEKKPAGYVSVILPPVASAPPAVVVNENVAAADVLPATRSDVAIANEGSVA